MPAEKPQIEKVNNPLFHDDCERPSCDDITKALPTSMEEFQAMSKKAKENKKVECPLRSAQLGRSSWNLLHSMTAWYPDKPTQVQQQKMGNFMSALAEFYPCTWCAQDFQENLQKSPVPTESRKELCTWLCQQHNLVNKKLGKPLFDCQMENLDERWRKSSNPKCQSDH